ncbi:polyisoprenoid-binding protein YceI [Dyadobacter sp. BE34]|uniref:Polyisoprenoid-binding protein YceI n=1 Tax=Dyadobacter fermentans TaxID=94254 RepID=A0ABU1QWX8_9BACT|nr:MULTISPECIES: YceI family protein [Dyadobacter]MDR6805656.1 polyisoprenoid-binding protein YceI [Dyadobacter fermentans]MDR7042584.1 polyisoprenoid-binding protein YceI [Dyadobacter sp. BE242]MDR7196896.1 polyisoprenoid-binding protein YceI [Dyadobacter sp. BE34]MDR7215669.1 polyisoprenoid-binding protein YceI [Dyadobacter sp. BE31]MDR7263205.1 polyisoprenoid-binding protein YceI [Dyadobacter sp. BE32]
MRKYLTVISLLVMSGYAFAMVVGWRIADGYQIRFDGKYAHGFFRKMEGNIRFDPLHPDDSHFEVSVDAASIDTGIELKNKHARSEKWFDAEKHPRIYFVSKAVSRTDTGFVVRGELELRGIKKEISIPFAFTSAGDQHLFYGKFKVNRGDFGIGKVSGKESDSTNVEVSVPVLSLE